MGKKKETTFRFKQFEIHHHKSTMKVGTDAVLLGAWANVDGAKRILEVGTGSGVIALMLAQRTSETAAIDALEIDADSVLQATENVKRSPWPTKVVVIPKALQDWKPDLKYDLIITNPPFFSKSLLPPDPTRTRARHSVNLSSADLLAYSRKLLAHNGTLSVVLPFLEGNAFIQSAMSNQFYLSRQTAVFTRKGKPQERWLLEFKKTEIPCTQTIITLFTSGNERSEAYNDLTSDFYLAK